MDFPAFWHGNGSTLSFADGHAEFWQWTDARTLAIRKFNVTTPNNPDLKRLQKVGGF